MKQDYHASWSSHDEPRQPHALSILSPAHRADMAMTFTHITGTEARHVYLCGSVQLENTQNRQSTLHIINPRRACAARVTVVVLSFCLSVCLSVTTFSAATRNKTANKRY